MMKQISKIIIFFGAIVSVTGMCGIDSDGKIFLMFLLMIFLGILIALLGFLMLTFSEKSEENRKSYFYEIRRKDRLDSDVEYIDLNEKIAP